MKLFKHQQVALEKSKQINDMALFHEPGLGKTRSELEIFKDRRRNRLDLRLLVVCPISLIEAAWGEDIDKFTDYTYLSYDKLQQGFFLPDIIIINYEKLIRKNHLDIIKKMVTQYDFMCAVDESSKMKNHKSSITKTLLGIEHLFRGRFILSGSPMPNSEMELWGQINFICPGLLCNSFFQFRNRYFELGRSGKIIRGMTLTRALHRELMTQGWKYQAKAGARELIMKLIEPYTHWVKKSEALDLPDAINEYRQVRLTGPERKAYEEMKKHFITEVGDKEIVANVALTKMMKLRQCASGFFYGEEKEVIEIGKSSKLAELTAVLDELGKQQAIIWIEFKKEAHDIMKLLDKRGTIFEILTGETKDKELAIRRFKDKTSQFLIAQPLSAAHGLTFVNCCTAIYYSYSFSYEQHYQSRERILRIGQNKKCLYIYLVSQDTLDSYILKVINDKRDLQDIIYDFVKKARR